MKKSFLLFLVVAFFCIACVPNTPAPIGELTRSLAKDILEKRGAYSGECLEMIYEKYITGGANLEWLSGPGKKLQDAGYISISAPDQKGTVHIKFLKKLKPFITYTHKDSDYIKVKLGNYIIDEITGITEAPTMGTNTRKVEYTALVEPNELANVLELPRGCEFNKTHKLTDVFKKYDDGWRAE
jgi:hypothetical protein